MISPDSIVVRMGDYPKHLKDIHYSDDSALNTLQACIPAPPVPGVSNKLWLIYIHGGAWRDPDILASSFDRLQDSLLRSEHISKIEGLASIDYRLSAYPAHSTNPSDPYDPARNARHPQHIEDVLHAILYLQVKYGFGSRYVLVGHSCGAFLALQVAMRRYWGSQYESSFAEELNVVPPIAIVGVEGIYSLVDLIREYTSIPAYRDFVANAFGSDEKMWQESSPVSGDFAETWPDGRLLVLAHSHADELLSSKQRQLMMQSIQSNEWSKQKHHQVLVRDLRHLKHDEVWQKPEQLRDLINEIVDLASESQ